MEDKIIKLYEKYGKIRKIHQDDNLNIMVYSFTCEIPKIMPSETHLVQLGIELDFLIIRRVDIESVRMYCFGLSNKETLGENAWKIINDANRFMSYGKFIIDEDGDLNWVITYDYVDFDTEELHTYIINCIEGIKEIVSSLSNKE